jgi:hypothetical protein
VGFCFDGETSVAWSTIVLTIGDGVFSISTGGPTGDECLSLLCLFSFDTPRCLKVGLVWAFATSVSKNKHIRGEYSFIFDADCLE